MIEAVEVIVRQPGQPDRLVRLQEGATRMGRADDNEIVLSDVGVSRRHAQIYVSRGEVTIEDLGSGNGTYYNGYRIQSQPIQNGDEVVIDPFVLQFRIMGLERAIPMADGVLSTPARLEVVVGTGMAGSSYPITAEGLSIGRSEDRHVVIPDPAASRHHCSILIQGDDYVLRDMGSANGVYVNAVRVRDCTLSDGDLIRIGNTEMRFVRYDQHVSDTTTQVVPHEVWNAGAGDPAFAAAPQQTILPREIPSAPPTRSRGGGLVGILVGIVIAVGALGALAVVGVGAALLYLSSDEPLVEIAPSPPDWKLQLPPGLESATASALFDAGVAKMRDGDRRGALQDFYRVLEADPGNVSAEKFAFAAGELLVLDALSKTLDKQVAARKAREDERSRLLREVRRPGRVGRNALAELEQKFREDQVVVDALRWDKTERIQILERKAREAADLLSELKYGEAAARYLEVLEGSEDPTLRKTAAAGLKVSQREMARAHAGTWTEAVMSEAVGEDAVALARFRELASDDPNNASIRLHLERLGE